MRSMTPPWPGKYAAAVLDPGKALQQTLGEITDDREADGGQAQRHEGRERHLEPDAAGERTSALRARPPSTPSQVLPGETTGASSTRPKRRPQKNAPMSATHTSTSANSTHCAPCGSSSAQPHQRKPRRNERQYAGDAADQARRARGANVTQQRARPPTRRPPTAEHQSRRAASGVQPPCAQQQHADQQHVGERSAAPAGAGTPTIPRRRPAPSRSADDGRQPAQPQQDGEQRGREHGGGEDSLAQGSVTMPPSLRPLAGAGWPEAPLAAGEKRERRVQFGRRRNPATGRSVKYSSVYARCQSRKLLMRCSPPVRINRSGSGRSASSSARRKRSSSIVLGTERAAGAFAREPLAGLHDVPAAAVAEGHLQVQRRDCAAVRSSAAAMRACRAHRKVRRVADEAHAHALQRAVPRPRGRAPRRTDS